MRITFEMLEKHNACFEQFNLFNKCFPDGIEPTLDMCDKYYNIFDFHWAAYYLLTSARKKTFDLAIQPTRETFDLALKSARDAYDIAAKSARDAYDLAKKSERDAYDIALKSAIDAYDLAKKSERDAYDIVICQEFVKQWIIQNSR